MRTTRDTFYALRLASLPVTSKEIARHTARDPVLSLVLNFTKKGWPSHVDKPLKPYFDGRSELTVHEGCLMHGMRVVVSPKLQHPVVEELHQGHPVAPVGCTRARVNFFRGQFHQFQCFRVGPTAESSAMSSKRLSCKECCMQFTGPVPYMDHMQSARHRKKMAALNQTDAGPATGGNATAPASNGKEAKHPAVGLKHPLPFVCKLCNMAMNCETALIAHNKVRLVCGSLI
ncbi:hypothetical protein V5799_020954 [Amblyomma americanum]|uniref:C2H2-type domain-containing protein n=1 Tax=Amblyomma americanum TaxID=6943 RepID=A0AAQ4ESG5_AMBAM